MNTEGKAATGVDNVAEFRSRPQPVPHPENFPVASLLCPPALRPSVRALYAFARTADDMADEGDASPTERLTRLAAYESELRAIHAGHAASGRWQAVFDPLARAIRAHALPLAPLLALLSAFAQDCRQPRLASRADVLDYCSRSANPVGRLLLHMMAVTDALSLRQSDHICTALQLINFWQDLSIDHPRGRSYVPLSDWPDQPAAGQPVARPPAAQAAALIDTLTSWAREQMLAGAPLARRVPGRMGWELRLVVQGGLRVLDKVQALGPRAFAIRPALGPQDAPLLLWRSLTMRAGHAADVSGRKTVDSRAERT